MLEAFVLFAALPELVVFPVFAELPVLCEAAGSVVCVLLPGSPAPGPVEFSVFWPVEPGKGWTTGTSP
jgi:hypothetical protein